MAQAVRYIMQVILFTMTLTYTLAISLDMFVIELSGAISIETLNAAFDLIITLMLLFTYCYLSECLTSDLLKIGEIFYNSAWYGWPVKQQKLLILSIGRGQHVFRLTSLELFECSLAIFSSVNSLRD